ncbi:MAG: hypothetical protein A2087_10575 [Spirochaetes bacterium GWD1_61_31]|nr:MAG: hypothetical protein A2Y37_11940 [Spirochaetes bacterium GWB1_60_80]OHD34656.1 MAG: hypothetical protein A2087_10575 [Spirochaetes bacterium GWD1_61_31]OHD46472.1 MAG: hypothetical protein A2Y35_10480 [Spirochaetes bacterium GWE1_60_18]HAW85775.1 hypothetical protein [Spirochaetaceae bacterium]HBO42149.1 hypothetical protein [Spirochaetaceae bacterium]
MLAARDITVGECYNRHMFKDKIVAAVRLLALAGLCSGLASCWYVTQAASFLGERLSARELSVVAAADDADERLQTFVEQVSAIRDYASSAVGLEPTRNYTRYVVLDRNYVALVVSACAPDSFERHYWQYPFLGALPYKGFYKAADAQAEAARLREHGLDVIVRPVDAFSSLGWFRDPLYSFMLDYDEDMLAELIFHESAHATLFIKGADQFNEEFATYVGRMATLAFLTERYGPGNPILQVRDERARNRQLFTDWLGETARQLELVYQDPGLTSQAVQAAKQRILSERAQAYRENAATLFSLPHYLDFDMDQINNAFLDLYRLYEDDLSLYEAWFERKADRSLPLFVSSLAELAAEHGGAIKQLMAEFLAGD